MSQYIGLAVSLQVKTGNSIFQGIIKNATESKITIVKAFRNGIPLKKPEMEVSIDASDIIRLELITSPSVPPKVEEEPRALPSAEKVTPARVKKNRSPFNNGFQQHQNGKAAANGHTKSKPIEILTRSERKKTFRNRNAAFNDEAIHSSEEFDFEKNLSLFNKEAIWSEIESLSEKPDLLRQAQRINDQRKLRNDENVLDAKPLQFSIETEFTENGGTASQFYKTDEGLIIPSIPLELRSRVISLAEANGLAWERIADTLASGASQTALTLLGGARRLMPKNSHQLPVVTVICDRPFNERPSEVGIATARILASHGLKVMVFVRTTPSSDRRSKELELFTATGNGVVFSPRDLVTSDLLILAVAAPKLDPAIAKWIAEQRQSIVMAIDPPVQGVEGVPLKCSVFPLLPVDGINVAACGRLYLCNLAVPGKFFRLNGIKYKSPFGAKSVITLHPGD